MYEIWRLFKEDFWPGHFQFYADYLTHIFPSSTGISGRSLRPVTDSIWDELKRMLEIDPGCLGAKVFCPISGPVEMMSNVFPGDGLLIEMESGEMLCVIPMPWGFNVYPEDPEFYLNTNPYFIGENKDAVREFLEKFVEFSKALNLKSLLDAAWNKFKAGMEEYEKTGGMSGFNVDQNDDIVIIYKTHLNIHTGRYMC